MTSFVPLPPTNVLSDAAQPGVLKPTPAISLSGARSILKRIPMAGGDTIEPEQTFEIQIPPAPTSFIAPNSMYLHVSFSIVSSNATAFAWAFSGQADLTGTVSTTNYNDPSPASSLFERIEIVFPNGATMNYNAYDFYSWGITCSHILPREYVRWDLKELMHCHTTRQSNPTAQITTLAIPLDLPVFNSSSAFPLCLLKDPITIRFTTNPVGRAICVNGDVLSGFRLTNIGLVYEELQMSLAWKQSFLQTLAKNPFSICVKDRLYIGSTNAFQSQRVNMGIHVSSLNAVLVLNTAPFSLLVNRKTSNVCGLVRWNVVADGNRLNQFEMDDISVCFAEMSRALGPLTDSTRASNVTELTSNIADARRTTYSAGQFLMGFSTRVYNDQLYTLSGIPVRDLAVEMERSATVDSNKFPRAGFVAGSYAQIFILHDTVCLVNAEGDVMLRR